MEDRFGFLSDEELNVLIEHTSSQLKNLKHERAQRCYNVNRTLVGKYYKEETDTFLEVFKVIDFYNDELITIYFSIDIEGFAGGRDINFFNTYPVYGLENCTEITKEEYDELLEFALREAKDICDSRINRYGE